MKKHVLSNYRTINMKKVKDETTLLTFTVETSDKDEINDKGRSTVHTEAVETSDRNEF